MWKYGPDNLKLKAALSFVATGFCGYWFVKNIVDYYYPRWFILDRYDWQWLTKAVAGLSAMKEVYACVQHNEMIRSLPDCAPVYDFFEKKVTEDSELHELMDLIESIPLDAFFGSHLFSGYTAKVRLLMKKKSKELYDFAVGIGRIEAYLCFARLLKQQQVNGYCFPTYAAADEQAVFHATGLWNAALSPAKTIPSDVMLGGESVVRNYLVTGANAGGKSTFLKSIGIGALMGQTIGIVPAVSCRMSVFSVLETYLNITDDIQQGNSLFKKEVMRAAELLKRADAIDGKPVLFIFDEMFSGTTPHEGISCATAVAEHIVQMPNVLSCMATHYRYLVKLTTTYPSIVNKCVRLLYDAERATYVRTYTIHDGISDQHVALDMLGEEGVHDSIVSSARNVLRDIEENGVGA